MPCLADPPLSRTVFSHFASLIKPCTESTSESDCGTKHLNIKQALFAVIPRNVITHTHTHTKRNVGMDVKLYPWGLSQSPFLSRLGKPSHNGREHNPLPTCGCVLWPSSQACCTAHVRAKPLNFISDPNRLRDFLVSFDFLCKIWYDAYAGIHILI